ncbi:hypothetical protein ACFLYK_00300 [Candidatus Cloacimonadota bacterium]
MKFIIIALLLIASTLSAMDYTIETTFGISYYEEYDDPETNLNGEVMLYLLDEDNITADAAFRVGDDGNYFNRARVKLIQSWWDLALGRQQIGWGNGYNFNPTDIFNAKPLGAAFDPAYAKRGRDSVILTTYWSDILCMEVIYGFAVSSETDMDGINIYRKTDWDLGGKLKTNLFDYDLAFTFTYTDYRTRSINDYFQEVLEPRKLAGISLVGSLPVIDFGVWLEGTYDIETEDYEFITGTEYVFLEDYTLNIEYYRNSSGEPEYENYDFNRMFFGELLAQDYLIPSLRYVASEKLEMSAFAFQNLNDSSSSLGLVFDYYYNDYVDFIITPLYLNGCRESEFGIQKELIGNYGIDLKVRLFL